MSKKVEKLCQACADGDLRRVTNLISGSIFSQKMDIDIQSNDFDGMFGGMTPLMCASMYGQLDVVTYLLKKGANVNVVQNKGNNTALIYALANSHLLIAKLLIEANADVSHRNNNNKTANNCRRERLF
jgi:ankyrin repeat protein